MSGSSDGGAGAGGNSGFGALTDATDATDATDGDVGAAAVAAEEDGRSGFVPTEGSRVAHAASSTSAEQTKRLGFVVA
jgi:hypothetical protein